MTIAAYIQTMAGKFGIIVPDNELLALFIDLDIGESEEYNKQTSQKAKKALVSVFSQLLISPKTVKEGNMTITQQDREAIIAFCNGLCIEAGIDNPFLVSNDTVTNQSFRW